MSQATNLSGEELFDNRVGLGITPRKTPKSFVGGIPDASAPSNYLLERL